MRALATMLLFVLGSAAYAQDIAGTYVLQSGSVETRIVIKGPDKDGAFSGCINGPNGLLPFSGRVEDGHPTGWIVRNGEGGVKFMLFPKQGKIDFSCAQFRADGKPVEGSFKKMTFVVFDSTAVRINGAKVEGSELEKLEKRFHFLIPPGSYWYDKRSGAWGMQGGPTLGIAQAGIVVGAPMQRDASNGNSGVIVNGRDLHRLDVIGLQQAGIQVLRGKWWVNSNGDFGSEGNPFPMGNLISIARQSQPSGRPYGSVYSGAAGGGVAFDGQGGFIASFRDNHGGFIGQYSGQ